MTDAISVNRIASILDEITSDNDLRTIVRDVQRRASKLDAQRAAGFKQGDRVHFRRSGRTFHGSVQGFHGKKVVVQLDHGSVYEIAARELCLSNKTLKLAV